MFSLAGKCAVVVGGTSGIGSAIAFGLASAGANVVASSRSKSAVETRTPIVSKRAAARHSASPPTFSTVPPLQSLHDAVLSSFGRIDILVNSAGITKRVPTLDCPEELWQSIMNVNLNGTLRACQIFGKTMLAQKKGRIINIASLSTFVCLSRSSRLRREQSRRRRSYPLAGRRVGSLRCLRQCNRSRYISDRSQPRSSRLPARQGAHHENADGPLWYCG